MELRYPSEDDVSDILNDMVSLRGASPSSLYTTFLEGAIQATERGHYSTALSAMRAAQKEAIARGAELQEEEDVVAQLYKWARSSRNSVEELAKES